MRPSLMVTLVLAGAIFGAILAIPAQALYDRTFAERNDIEAELSVTESEDEASLDDAIHAAAEEAVLVDDGKYKGESLEIARIELTADNPHITAYRVILRPTG